MNELICKLKVRTNNCDCASDFTFVYIKILLSNARAFIILNPYKMKSKSDAGHALLQLYVTFRLTCWATGRLPTWVSPDRSWANPSDGMACRTRGTFVLKMSIKSETKRAWQSMWRKQFSLNVHSFHRSQKKISNGRDESHTNHIESIVWRKKVIILHTHYAAHSDTARIRKKLMYVHFAHYYALSLYHQSSTSLSTFIFQFIPTLLQRVVVLWILFFIIFY